MIQPTTSCAPVPHFSLGDITPSVLDTIYIFNKSQMTHRIKNACRNVPQKELQALFETFVKLDWLNTKRGTLNVCYAGTLAYLLCAATRRYGQKKSKERYTLFVDMEGGSHLFRGSEWIFELTFQKFFIIPSKKDQPRLIIDETMRGPTKDFVSLLERYGE
jgi:hypothetical protein